MKYRGVCPLALFFILLSGCGSASSSKGDSPVPQRESASSTDAAIRLKPEDAKNAGIESVEVVESDVVPVIAVVARVRTRAGGEAPVFSPFPGRLIGELALPRIGDSVTRGQHLADVEQQFAASEKLQFTTTAIDLQARIEQAQQEVDLKRTEVTRAQELYDGGASDFGSLEIHFLLRLFDSGSQANRS